MFDFESYLNKKLEKVKFELPETQAYTLKVMKQQLQPEYDLSKDIIILKYAEAKSKYCFISHQQIADWLLFVLSEFPEAYQPTNYYSTIAQVCYGRCYRMVNKSWNCLEELSDRFNEITSELRVIKQESLLLKK